MSSKSTHIVLKAKDLNIGYFSKKKQTEVASTINFAIPKGQLVSLVGANGVGKSTLLRTLCGMQPALSGTVEIHSESITKSSPLTLASQLSVVLTEAPASKNLTVNELVSLGRQPHTNWMGKLSTTDIEAIQKALLQTEIQEMAHRKCFELSDGQLQRVYIARALAQETPIIVLDEPTTHLDLYHRASILKLLKELSATADKTILFSTHEIDLAIQLSDTMLLMSHEQTHFDTPCKLISQGRFDALFPKDTIEFDSETGRFSVKK